MFKNTRKRMETEHKPHRKNKAGRKAEKKKAQLQQKRNGTDKGDLNPKAFTPHSAVNAARQFVATSTSRSKTSTYPLFHRTPEEPPPALIAVVGPPGVGKTTLIKFLVQHFHQA